MRRVDLPQINNKNVTQKIIVVSTVLLFSACSPLSNRLDGPDSDGAIYPLSDTFVTNSISPGPRLNYAESRRVTSRSLAPIEAYSANQPADRPARKSTDGVVIVRSGDSLLGVAREQGVDAVDLAELNGLEAPYELKVGEELILPGSRAAKLAATNRGTPSRRVVASTPQAKVKRVKTVAVPEARPKEFKVSRVILPHKKIAFKSLKKKTVQKRIRVARIQKSVISEKQAVKRVTSKPVESRRLSSKKSTGGKNNFRWPVRGRAISEFGSKSNGARNDGINLSVPKGAAIVAAENGVVVYSGNELKGYGNLVLIRHKGGWSTAYAHVSKMLVKKGQKVRRGQVIAKAGQTGSVSRPQLHFEIRRGTTPVNPRKLLSSTKVAIR